MSSRYIGACCVRVVCRVVCVRVCVVRYRAPTAVCTVHAIAGSRGSPKRPGWKSVQVSTDRRPRSGPWAGGICAPELHTTCQPRGPPRGSRRERPTGHAAAPHTHATPTHHTATTRRDIHTSRITLYRLERAQVDSNVHRSQRWPAASSNRISRVTSSLTRHNRPHGPPTAQRKWREHKMTWVRLKPQQLI